MTNVQPAETADNSPRFEDQMTQADGYKCPSCRYPADAYRHDRVRIHPKPVIRETVGISGVCLRPCGWKGELH